MLNYIQLIKPGIIIGNICSMIGGFFLASKGDVHFNLLCFSILSLSLVIASSCIINNILDRDLDQYMHRTKNRLLVVNSKLVTHAIVFSIFLGLFGFLFSYFFLNNFALIILLIGVIIYVIFYTVLFKRKTVYSTFIGSIAGSMPPLFGYFTVVHHFDYSSVILFLTFFLWQIPHFYSIGICRIQDYKKARIPIFPLIKGIKLTKIHIMLYILLFFLFSSMFTYIQLTGKLYFFSNLIFSVLWFFISFLTFLKSSYCFLLYKILFFCSILVIMNLSIMMSIDYVI
ncbi:Protoheme IX farnesyltransferase [Buchnera aphidicola (Eriosoma lanigerum)]|uniref:heme o synthase n=1 Tax=Buchnera aphidicola TaxID=9 RepID=UPI0034643627